MTPQQFKQTITAIELNQTPPYIQIWGKCKAKDLKKRTQNATNKQPK